MVNSKVLEGGRSFAPLLPTQPNITISRIMNYSYNQIKRALLLVH